MKMNGIEAHFENSEVIDTRKVENVESIEASPETVDMDPDSDGLFSDEILEGIQEQLDVSDTPVEFIGELDSRKRNAIQLEIHEAQAKIDYHTRRKAALFDSGLNMAYAQHERAARSWRYRLAKLKEELKNCKD